VIFIDRDDVAKTADIVKDFHHAIHPDDFRLLQYKTREIWHQYLSYDGFANWLLKVKLLGSPPNSVD
jgi:hypothetical protein